MFEEQNLGIPFEEALENLTDRVPNLDLKFFVTAVILQRQTGGDLAEILDKIGHLIRERLRFGGRSKHSPVKVGCLESCCWLCHRCCLLPFTA